jgi:FkbM family methyltransferase
MEVLLTKYGIILQTNSENKILILHKKEFDEIKIIDWEENGDLYGVFCKNDYNSLPVFGSDVIDIGANIGDTSIYFAKLGAKKVIALEPSPINYESAKKNIALNNLNKKIELLLAACSSQDGNIKIDPNKKGVKLALQKNINSNIEIPSLSLNSILKLCSNNTIVLKMDCEGCEYETILLSHEETLKKISYILLEYHDGYLNLKSKLEKCGFKVRVTNPDRRRNENLEKSSTFVGYLFAENYAN